MAVIGVTWGGIVLAVSTCGLGRADNVRASSAQPRIAFDIPAQPLAQALNTFVRATGMAALVDQDLTMNRRSTAVKGMLAGDQALRILVLGTGLSVRYAGAHAFTLSRGGPLAHADTRSGAGVGFDRRAYFSELEGALTRTLCRNESARRGSYRLAMQVWIGAAGDIQAAHMLASSGDRARDARIAEVLRMAVVTAPPATLPQPVTVVLRPGEGAACGDGGVAFR